MGNCLNGTFANREGHDETLQSATFHQDLRCLLRHNQSLEKEIQYFLEIMTSIYSMDHPDFFWGAQWLSGRVLDSRPRGHMFEPHRVTALWSLSKTHLS